VQPGSTHLILPLNYVVKPVGKILVMIPMLLVPMILYMATPTPLEKLGVSLAMLERLRSSRGPRLKLRLGLARVFMAVKSELSQYLAQAGKLILLMMVKIRFALLRMLSLEFMRGLLLMRVLGMKIVKKLYLKLLFVCLCHQTRLDALLEKVGISSKESAVRLVRKYACLVMIIFQHVPLMVMNFSRLVAHVNSCIT